MIRWTCHICGEVSTGPTREAATVAFQAHYAAEHTGAQDNRSDPS